MQGMVLQVMVNRGATVKKGDTLIVLTLREMRVELARISQPTWIIDNNVFSGADIPVCRNRYVLLGRQGCLPHYGKNCGLEILIVPPEKRASLLATIRRTR